MKVESVAAAFVCAVVRVDTSALLGVWLRTSVRGVMMLVLCWSMRGQVHAQQQATTPTALVFDGVTVVDVGEGKLVPDQRVVITGNRIAAVGGAGMVKVPKEARVIDAGGRYLMPGLWDMHTHVSATPEVFSSLLANGVIGIQDMGVAPGRFDSILRWRREVLAGTRLGPRILTAGPVLDVKLGDANLEVWTVATPEEGRRAVDSLKAAGADFIKIRSSSMSREIYFAIAAESRRVGIPFVGHLPVAVPVAEASDSGQRSIEHGNEIQSPCSGPVASSQGWPYAKEDEVGCAAHAAQFIRNGTWFTPTIGILTGFLGQLETQLGQSLTGSAKDLLRESHRFGVPMLAGTDNWLPLSEELKLLVDVGKMTPLEALRTATLNPAKYFGATDSLGTVARGKLAELVILDADPLEDISNTTRISAVVANGRYFDRAALDDLLAAAAGPEKGERP